MNIPISGLFFIIMIIIEINIMHINDVIKIEVPYTFIKLFIE